MESNDMVTVCVRYKCYVAYKTVEVLEFQQLHKLLFDARFHFKWRFSVLNRDPMGRTQRTEPKPAQVSSLSKEI